MKLGQENVSDFGKLQFEHTLYFKFQVWWNWSFSEEVFNFMKNTRVILELLIVFVDLYIFVDWSFTVFIILNILLRLENILLFGLIFMIYICGNFVVRQRYPLILSWLEKAIGNLFTILIVLLSQLIAFRIITVSLTTSYRVAKSIFTMKKFCIK